VNFQDLTYTDLIVELHVANGKLLQLYCKPTLDLKNDVNYQKNLEIVKAIHYELQKRRKEGKIL
jgi:hypothetical protein